MTPTPLLLCRLDDIPADGAKGFTVQTQSLFAVRRDGAVFVYRNRCPHLGVELNWLEDQFLDLDGELIQCATHGALFVTETRDCGAGPCRGRRLDRIPCAVIDGALHVQLDPAD
jgi:nitrite reductase/ring-hydroxylating ferredoxin subunit